MQGSIVKKIIIVSLITAIFITLAAIVNVAFFDPGTGPPRTEMERAIRQAEEAVQATPDDGIARSRLAAAYLEVGKYGDAIREVEYAIRLSPDLPDGDFVLGLAYRGRGDFEQAERTLAKVTEIEGQYAPFYQAAWYELANTYADREKYEEAIEAYYKALSYGPESATILYDLASMYELIGDIDIAAEYYGYVLDFIPDYEEAIEALARLEGQTE